jgi:hypothetical protein
MNKITRIEPVESWGKWALDIRIGDKWQHFHTDYRCIVDSMAERIEAAVAAIEATTVSIPDMPST